MLKRWQFVVLTVIGAAALLLVAVNMTMFAQNRETQAELNARAQYVQQTVPLRSLHQEMVKALADLAVRNQDTALRDLLASQGITFNAPGEAARPAPGPDPKKAVRK